MPRATRVFTSQIYQAKVVTPGGSLFKDLAKEARQIQRADDQGARWSKDQYPNGYTSYGSWDQLHRMSPNFEALKKKIDVHVKKYVKMLAWDVNPRDIQMTRIWLNIMPENTVHTMHIHPLSVVSGTFYLHVPKGSSPLKFEDPRFTQFMGRPPVKPKAAREHQSFLNFDPRPGEILLFESWMRHEVPIQTGKAERISISFNYDWIRGA